MTAARPQADLRGFAWPLASAERQRQHHVDRASGQLAVLQREHDAQARELEMLRSGHEQDLRQIASVEESSIDPALRRHAIRHLQQSLVQISRCEQQFEVLQWQVLQAQRLCVEARQRLEAARTLRETALSRYVRDQARREAKVADLAWLVSRAATLAQRRPTEGTR